MSDIFYISGYKKIVLRPCNILIAKKKVAMYKKADGGYRDNFIIRNNLAF